MRSYSEKMGTRTETEELRRPVAESSGLLPSIPVRSLSPRRITAVYLLFGLVALVLSDLVLLWLLEDPVLRWVQAAKGAIEVLLTASLIYVLTVSGYASLQRTAKEADRHRTELQLLHRVLRHNLRNNLTLVLGNARRLRADLEDPSRRAVCEEVITAANEMDHWTEEAGKIRRATADADPTEVDLEETITATLDRVDGIDDEVTVDRTVPDHARVLVSPQFELAIEELLANAVEHAGGPTPTIEIAVNCQGARTVIEISDDGPGFPEHVLAVVNDGQEDDLVHLDGLGLWLAYLVVASSGGELVLENAADGAQARISVQSA